MRSALFAAVLAVPACLTHASPGRAQSPAVLVKDINEQLVSYGVQPAWGEAVDVDGTAFFLGCADDGTTGCELWKSDGTAAGTVLVKDIVPGSGSSVPQQLTNVNGTLFFVACSSLDSPFSFRDCELWKSDGTESGTVDVIPGIDRSSPDGLTNVSGTLFFSADDGIHGRGLWKSDGTEAGTQLVKASIGYGSIGHGDGSINVNGTLFFAGEGGLWKSDGTEAGTHVVKELPFELSEFANVNGTLYFTARDRTNGTELWRSDGTEAGTILVKDINPGSLGSEPGGLTNVSGTLFFSAASAADPGDPVVPGDRELWRSDGTAAGTVRVKDILPGNGSSEVGGLTNVNGTLYFAADDGMHGRELWTSDGTEDGTVLVKDIIPGSLGSWPNYLTNVSGTLFFSAASAADPGDPYDPGDRELWRSDGTAAGTVRVKDILPGKGSSSPFDLSNVNGTLYFAADDGTHGRELWTSDGTLAGTSSVTEDFPPGTGTSDPQHFTNVNGTLFFSADDGLHGAELWKSDGVGTVLVKDILPGSGGSSPYELTNVNGTLFFAACSSVSDAAPWDCELWKSDGTEGGTLVVKEILPGSAGSAPRELTNVNGTLFFAACSSVSGCELWKSDGTDGGTTIVKDLVSGVGSSDPQSLTNVNGTVFFSADDGIHGRELWKSDGTAAGTVLVKDILLGDYFGSSPSQVTNVNGTLFFSACSIVGWGPADCELWKSDGTETGTVLVKDIADHFVFDSSYPKNLTDVKGTLYFTADDGTNGRELWKSNGTAAGTVLVKDIAPEVGGGGSEPEFLTDLKGTLFFRACSVFWLTDCELWKSDGTETGTVLVKDIDPGPRSSSPESVTRVGGGLFFTARDGASGEELWRSDGTEAGTRLVAELVPGSGGSVPRELTVAGPSLFFSAVGDGIGRELWLLPIPEPDARLLALASVGTLALLARRRAHSS